MTRAIRVSNVSTRSSASRVIRSRAWAFVLARQKVLERLVGIGTSSGAMAERRVQIARFSLPYSYYDSVAGAHLTLSELDAFLLNELAARCSARSATLRRCGLHSKGRGLRSRVAS